MNATPYVLVLTGVVGDNEGVPNIGAPLCPNVGYEDFEVTWHAAAINEVSATFDVDEGRFGTKVGTAQVNMTVNAIGDVNTSGVMVLDQGGAHALNISASDTKFPQILS